VTPGDDEFAEVARQALRSGDGNSALDALGWWELLAHLDDPEARAAVFALPRAQGRELANSTALGALMAQPYLDVLGGQPGSLVAAVTRRSVQRGHVFVVVGDTTGRRVLVDRPGEGATVVDAADVDLQRVEVPGRLSVHEASIDRASGPVTLGDAACTGPRARSTVLGRVAIALEVLGAAEGAVALALEHARAREQFGQPIGAFQAVRHLLAWATTDCTAIERVTAEAVALGAAAPPRYGDIAKALAGRNGRRACERALQVLGAIGFTAEHDHHHFHGRVLTLDALLGTSARLTRELGAWWREQHGEVQMASAMLLAP